MAAVGATRSPRRVSAKDRFPPNWDGCNQPWERLVWDKTRPFLGAQGGTEWVAGRFSSSLFSARRLRFDWIGKAASQ